MSLLNIAIDARRALVLVDTDAKHPTDQGNFELSKFSYVPSLNAIIAGRGNSLLLNLVGFLAMRMPIPDFESLIEAMPAIILEAYKHVDPAYLEANKDLYGRQELVAVGWSEARARMCCIWWERESPAADIMMDELKQPGGASPWDESLGAMEMSQDLIGMLALARRQVAWGHEHHPEAALGGRFIAAELTRHQVSITSNHAAPVKRVQTCAQSILAGGFYPGM